MWKTELKAQITGSYDKRERRGMRTKRLREESEKKDSNKPEKTKHSLLGKRDRSSSGTKTATSHKSNTSTFKNQSKKK
jgi:hypothetical protein